jgi:uncharacterized membrane protein
LTDAGLGSTRCPANVRSENRYYPMILDPMILARPERMRPAPDSGTPLVHPDVNGRLPVVDLLRGLAIVQMVAYHFVYDLTYFKWLHIEMTREPGWIAWRNAIVSQFLLVAGIGIGLAAAAGRPDARFWRRWLQIAGSAALVSIASACLFGPRLIWFGVLHFVALALVVTRPLPALGALNLGIGAAAVALGTLVRDARFDPAWLSWIGLVAHKPATEDYVPVLPWIGVVAIGIGVTHLWQRAGYPLPRSLQRLDSAPALALRWLGRWPLTVYLVHQPILMAVLWLVRQATSG